MNTTDTAFPASTVFPSTTGHEGTHMGHPGITFGAVFTRGMIDLLHTRLTPQLTHRAVIEAERFDAAQALANGLVDDTAGTGDLRTTAITNLHAHALATLGSAPASELPVSAVLAR